MKFMQYRDTDDIADFGFVRVLDAVTNLPLGAEILTNIGGIDGAWGSEMGDFPPEAAGKDVRLEFQFTSDNGSEFGGWFLDDIEVLAK